MCEPHTARHQRDTQATQQQDITASASITDTTMSSEKATSTHSPLSPPGSPSTNQIQPQSIDVLASQLGSSSLSQYNHDNHTLSTANIPESALSPISLPDDHAVNVSSMLSQYHSRPMEIDADHGSSMVTLQDNSTSEKQTVPTASTNTPFVPFSPIAVDPTALAEAPASISMFRPNAFGGFEVDEGYCEDDDDFSWLPSVASLRAASTPDGVKKRYGLGYRRSVDAASRCRNTIHSVPRMRRRDKKRSKHSQSTAGSLRSRSDSQASSMVAAQ